MYGICIIFYPLFNLHAQQWQKSSLEIQFWDGMLAYFWRISMLWNSGTTLCASAWDSFHEKIPNQWVKGKKLINKNTVHLITLVIVYGDEYEFETQKCC